MIAFTSEDMLILKTGKGPWSSRGDPDRGWQQMVRVEFIPSDCCNKRCDQMFLDGCYEVTKNGGGRITTIPANRPDLLAQVIQAIAGEDGEKFWQDLYSEEDASRKEYKERVKRHAKERKIGYSELSIDDLLL